MTTQSEILATKNIEILNHARLHFVSTNNNFCLCFRDNKKPMVDYYPGRGSWRIVGLSKSELMEGDVYEFIKWYEGITLGTAE